VNVVNIYGMYIHVYCVALGEIPAVIYNCKELTYLDFSTNPLGRFVNFVASVV